MYHPSKSLRQLDDSLGCRAFCLVLALLFVAVPAAEAACMSGRVQVWPESGSVTSNSFFLLQGFGLDQAWVGAVGPCDMKLVAPADEVCLHGVVSNGGELGLQQVLLQPEQHLIPGMTYTLQYPRELKGRGADGFPRHSGLPDVSWTVEDREDRIPPRWTRPARIVATEHARYGCGPATFAKVEVGVADDGLVLAQVSLRDAGSKATRTYLLPIVDDRLIIGHGMCSGAFDVEPGQAYEAQIELLDMAGNRASEASPMLRFEIDP